MKNYSELLQDILDNGFESDDRTGVGTIKVFDRSLRFDMSKGFPILTTRRVALRIAFEELMWMMRGHTDANILKNKNIHIWDGNTTNEFQESVGLGYLPEGSIGKGYGHQIRNFGGSLGKNDGVDQLTELVSELKKNPNGRRHMMVYWNPDQIHSAVLPPCHFGCQFMVTGNKLNLKWFQRSVDTTFGLPYNIMFYGLFLELVAKLTGYEAGELAFTGTDVHIYKNQVPMVKEQLTREPKELPKLNIKKDIKTLDDMLSLEFTDVELIGYDPHPDIKNKPGMAV